MRVKVTPVKQIYFDFCSNYRVLCCKTDDECDIELSKYKTLTIAGYNLDDLKINQSIEVDVELDTNSKYEASYKLVGVPGMTIEDGEIVIPLDQEYPILRSFMNEQQVDNVLSAYPDFVQFIVDGKIVDYKNIKNVGVKRLNEYTNKIKNMRDKLLFTPTMEKYGIKDFNKIDNVILKYHNVADFKFAMEENPYDVYMRTLEYSFEKADKLVVSHFQHLIDSQLRCQYVCKYILQKNEYDGNTNIDAKLLAKFVYDVAYECMPIIKSTVTDNPIFHYDNNTNMACLQSTYDDEQKIANVIKGRIANPVNMHMNCEPFYTIGNLALTDEQKQILHAANEKSVVMLNANAGCGKTFSTKALIKMLEANGFSYTLLSPTGIASKRLSEATGRQAYTIHRFLLSHMELGRFLILDEASMVGVHLMSKLFDLVNDDTKIIFICDEAQLASIECGNIVQDIIDSNIVPVVKLTKVWRYGEGGIATVSSDIRQGYKFTPKEYEDFRFIQIKDGVNQVVEQYEKFLKQGYNKDDIMILSPYNKGNYGSYAINSAIQEKFNKNPDTIAQYKRDKSLIKLRVGDKVVNTKNNYHPTLTNYNDELNDFALFNGDIGEVVRVREKDGAPVICVAFDGVEVVFDGKEINNLLLAYCMSIHRIQGSQAKVVIIVCDESHTRMATRNLMYVATSRSQEQLVLISDVDVINKAIKIEENKKRETNLRSLLCE